MDEYSKALEEIRKMHPLKIANLDNYKGLLEGILRCKSCDRYMTTVSHLGGNYNSMTRIYRCRGNQRKKCKNKTINTLYIDNFVVDYITSFFEMGNESIMNFITQSIGFEIIELNKKIDELTNEISETENEISTLISKVKTRIDNDEISKLTLRNTFSKADRLSMIKHSKALEKIAIKNIDDIKLFYSNCFSKPYDINKMRNFIFDFMPIIAMNGDEIEMYIDITMFIDKYMGVKLFHKEVVDRNEIIKYRRGSKNLYRF